jgi:hypothetical protein
MQVALLRDNLSIYSENVQLGSTIAAVSLRTTGRTSSNVGNAISHDKAHAPGQICTKRSLKPTPLAVLMIDTTQVMKMDSKKGMTSPANRCGRRGRPKKVCELRLNGFIENSVSRQSKARHSARLLKRPAGQMPAEVGALIDVNAYGDPMMSRGPILARLCGDCNRSREEGLTGIRPTGRYKRVGLTRRRTGAGVDVSA